MALLTSVSCAAGPGTGIIALEEIDGVGTDYLFELVGAGTGYFNDGQFSVADLPQLFTGLADDTYTLTAGGQQATIVVACTQPDPLTLVSVSRTNQTAPGVNDGTATVTASGGVAPLTASIAGPTVRPAQPTASGLSSTFNSLAPGSYTLTVTDSDSPPVSVNGPVSVAAFQVVTPVPGCTDPTADNYNPLATQDDGSCTFAPRLTLTTAVPPLVANGRPVPVRLASAAIPGAVGASAYGSLNLAGLGSTAGVSLVVNGYRLESGPLLLGTQFNDALTLVEALQAIPPLAAGYVIAQSSPDTVRLTARTPGTAGNLLITTSDAGRIGIATVPGTDTLRSQGWAQFGVWLEVWCTPPGTEPVTTLVDEYTDAHRDAYGVPRINPAGPGVPQLAQRMELGYRADNDYAFDIAPALRQFTGHAYPVDGECPDRLVSYFLRFGELYARPGTARRQQSAYQSGAGLALDAVEIMPEDFPGYRRLSRRPGTVRVAYDTQFNPFLLPLLLSEAVRSDLSTRVDYSAFDGVPASFAEPPLAPGPAGASVVCLSIAGTSLDRTLRGVLVASTSLFSAAPVALEIAQVPEEETHSLTFANGQGGFDNFLFEGIREETTKRTASTYATPTGTATRAAEVPEAFRLTSGPLTRAEYLWLRRELGSSPAVWLETPDGPQAVNLTAFSPDTDEVKAEYFLSVDCEPQQQPAYGLTN